MREQLGAKSPALLKATQLFFFYNGSGRAAKVINFPETFECQQKEDKKRKLMSFYDPLTFIITRIWHTKQKSKVKILWSKGHQFLHFANLL